MRPRKGGGPQGGTDKELAELECPKCGCPNRPTDTLCIYCRTELATADGGLKGFMFQLAHAMKLYIRIYKMKASSEGVKNTLKFFLTILISTAFIVTGGFLIFGGLSSGASLNWALGALLLIYGISGVYNLYSSIRKS